MFLIAVKFRPILILRVGQQDRFNQIMTYLHFNEFNSLQSQYNQFDICLVKQNALMISNATFFLLFYFLVIIQVVYGQNVYYMYFFG